MRTRSIAPCGRWALGAALVAGVLAVALWQNLPARAQIAVTQQGPTGGPQKTVVFDFVTERNVSPSLSAKATDALVIELTDTQKFDITTRQQVNDAIGSLRGLTFPLDKISQLKVAKKLEATTILTGRVRRVSTQSNPPRGVVELDVFQMDVAGEELINGARIVGDTGAREDITDPDQLIDAALYRAAYAAVVEMERMVLPTGFVLILDSLGEVTLNMGLRSGVRVGQYYMVTRDIFNPAYNGINPRKYETHRVATLRIVSVEASQSTARVVWARRGVKTGDRVRQIFSLGRGGRAVELRASPRY